MAIKVGVGIGTGAGIAGDEKVGATGTGRGVTVVASGVLVGFINLSVLFGLLAPSPMSATLSEVSLMVAADRDNGSSGGTGAS